MDITTYSLKSLEIFFKKRRPLTSNLFIKFQACLFDAMKELFYAQVVTPIFIHPAKNPVRKTP